MKKLRFFIAWIISSLVMFSCFYAWHGLFLNDFSRLNYPKEVFFSSAAIAYLIVGLVVNIVYEFIAKRAYTPSSSFVVFKKKPMLKGLVAGAASGISIFIVTIVLGVSFSNGYTLSNLLLDVSWQMIEQAVGGISIGIVHIVTFNPEEFMEREFERF